MEKKFIYEAPEMEQLEIISEQVILVGSMSDQNTETMPVEEETDF